MMNKAARCLGAGLATACVAAAMVVVGVAGDRAARAQTPANLEKVTIALDWVPTMPQHMGYWLAKSKGWYGEVGLDVTIEGGRGSGQVIQLLAGGKAEFGNASASTLVQSVAKQNVPMKMVGLFFQRDTAGIGYLRSSGIEKPKDFEGRKLGLVPGGIHYILWPSFARAAGIDANKVQILNTDFRFNYQQLMAGQFDGINWVIHGAGEAQLEEQGKPMAGFLFADYVPLMGHGLIVPDKMIAERPAVVKAFVGATIRAWDYLAREPEKATIEAATVVNQSVEKAPPAAMLSRIALKAVPTFMRSPATAGKPVGWSSPKEWQAMIDLLADLDKFPRKPEVAQVMTNQFIE